MESNNKGMVSLKEVAKFCLEYRGDVEYYTSDTPIGTEATEADYLVKYYIDLVYQVVNKKKKDQGETILGDKIAVFSLCRRYGVWAEGIEMFKMKNSKAFSPIKFQCESRLVKLHGIEKSVNTPIEFCGPGKGIDATDFNRIDKYYFVNKINFHSIFFNYRNVRAAHGYPLSWITDLRPSTIRGVKQKEHFAPALKKSRAGIDTCSDEEVPLPHQRLIMDTLRPFSPIKSELVAYRTGSGKTKIMKQVLENFAHFPNRKLILLPTDEVRAELFKEMSKQPSAYSSFFKSNGKLERVLYTDVDDGVVRENLDPFSTKFSVEAQSPALMKSNLTNFASYIRAVANNHIHGSVVILTFYQFYSIIEDASNATDYQGMANFVDDNGRLTLDGAMVLVDEAHLLVSDKQTQMTPMLQGIHTFLKEQARLLYCLGLFTATPFSNLREIIKYRGMLNIDDSHSFQSIAQNYLAYYGGRSPILFNDERYSIEKVENTMMDNAILIVPQLKGRTWASGNPEQKGSTQAVSQYILSEIKKRFPANTDAIDWWTKLSEFTSDEQYIFQTTFMNDLGRLMFPKGHTVAAHLKDMMTRRKFKYLEAKTSVDRQKAKEIRAVVMLDMGDGLQELSDILRNMKIDHMLFGTAKYEWFPLSQVFSNKFDDKLAEIENRDITGSYRDEDIVDLFNDNPDDIAIMLFNSYEPEGINIHSVTHMHVVTETHDDDRMGQIVGRINRLCGGKYGKTLEDKSIIFHQFGNYDYCNAVNMRKTWSIESLNPPEIEDNYVCAMRK